MGRGRKPRSIRGDTLASRVLDIAFRHKAQRLGIEKYSMARLERESGLAHSMIARAAAYDPEKKMGTQPKVETVERMATTLEVDADPELEDAFYNGFNHASPRQRTHVRTYVEQRESKTTSNSP